jgi:hypothetical protein
MMSETTHGCKNCILFYEVAVMEGEEAIHTTTRETQDEALELAKTLTEEWLIERTDDRSILITPITDGKEG